MNTRIERMEKIDAVLDMTVREFLDAIFETGESLQEDD